MIRKLTFLSAILFFPSYATSLLPNDEPLLEAEDAFRILVTIPKNQHTLRIEYAIAEGYYLYRHRFDFKSQSPGIKLGEPLIPKGEIKEDEYFGKVETYRHQVIINIPFEISTDKQPEAFELKTISQGCADAGVCYPILTQTMTLSLKP